MFSSNQKNRGLKSPKVKIMDRSIIAKNTVITGEIRSDGDFRIDGTLEGSLITEGRVIIGSEGFVKGNIEAANADIEGKIFGKLIVSKTLAIKAIANISGEVIVGKLSVEPGAVFNATCAMRTSAPKPEKFSTNEAKKAEKKFVK